MNRASIDHLSWKSNQSYTSGNQTLHMPPTEPSNPTSFYVETGNGSFESTELTRGPWDRTNQHAGPPAALLARAIELMDGVGSGPADRVVARITYEILRPVPIAAVTVITRTIRPGRRVELVEAELSSAADGEPLLLARAWRLLSGNLELPEGISSAEPGGIPARSGRPNGAAKPPRLPGEIVPASSYFPTGEKVGYHTGMELRFESGAFLEPGPATCWLRMLAPLVEGEEATPLQRVAIAADVANGISAAIDFRRYVFVNVDLTIHLSRMPEGEWVCVDALTVPEPGSTGISDAQLRDQQGPLGRANQTLVFDERPEPLATGD